MSCGGIDLEPYAVARLQRVALAEGAQHPLARQLGCQENFGPCRLDQFDSRRYARIVLLTGSTGQDVPRISPLGKSRRSAASYGDAGSVSFRGQAVIEVEACGVCRTDLHVFDGELQSKAAFSFRTRDRRRRHGRAARSIASRASPKRAIHGCERRWSSLRGCGCAISRAPGCPAGLRSASLTAALARKRRLMEICERRHHYRGGGHEIRLTDDSSTAKLFQSSGPHRPDGSRRTDRGSSWLQRREQGWSRSPEPSPAVSGIVVQPLRAATVCEVVQARRPGR